MIFFFTGDQRNLVSGNFLSIQLDPSDTFLDTRRFMDLNMIFRSPEMAFYRKITKTSRQTRIYRKSVILWLDSICEYTYGSVLWMSLISSMQDGQILR